MTGEPGLRSVAEMNTSAVDLVISEIRRSILTGALPPGERFSVRELARQLGVSHIPIREALRRLEGEGLVLLHQGRSAQVASLSVPDLDAIYRLRLRLEPALAADAAPLHTDGTVAELATLLDRMDDVDPEVAWQAHTDFHFAIVQPAATAWDERVLRTMWTAAERYTHLVFDYANISDGEREARHARHGVLLDAVRAGEGADLATALEEHLVANLERARRSIETVEASARERARS